MVINTKIISSIFCAIFLVFGNGVNAYNLNKITYFEIGIFNSYLLIPNTYSFNSLYSSGGKKSRDAPVFVQQDRLGERVFKNPGDISIGKRVDCDLCDNPNLLASTFTRTKFDDLSVIDFDVTSSETYKVKTFLIYNHEEFILFLGGDLDFVGMSLEHYKEYKIDAVIKRSKSKGL